MFAMFWWSGIGPEWLTNPAVCVLANGRRCSARRLRKTPTKPATQLLSNKKNTPTIPSNKPPLSLFFSSSSLLLFIFISIIISLFLLSLDSCLAILYQPVIVVLQTKSTNR